MQAVSPAQPRAMPGMGPDNGCARMGLFMPSNRPAGVPVQCLALAGVETGIAGGLTALAWLAIHSLWSGLPAWTYPNLLASTFHGPSVLNAGFRAATLSGLALDLFTWGVLGIVFGLLIRDHSRRLRVVLLGMAFALLWYYLSHGFLWKRVNSLVPLYSPERAVVVAHLLYGLVLGTFPARLSSLCRAWGEEDEPETAALPSPPAEPNC